MAELRRSKRLRGAEPEVPKQIPLQAKGPEMPKAQVLKAPEKPKAQVLKAPEKPKPEKPKPKAPEKPKPKAPEKKPRAKFFAGPLKPVLPAQPSRGDNKRQVKPKERYGD